MGFANSRAKMQSYFAFGSTSAAQAKGLPKSGGAEDDTRETTQQNTRFNRADSRIKEGKLARMKKFFSLREKSSKDPTRSVSLEVPDVAARFRARKCKKQVGLIRTISPTVSSIHRTNHEIERLLIFTSLIGV